MSSASAPHPATGRVAGRVGCRPAGPHVAARITGSSPDTTPPTTPGSLLATGGQGRVSLNWAPSTDNTAVTGYQIWRRQSASKCFTQVATVNDTSYVDGSLARRTTYYYQARAYDAAANLSAFSNCLLYTSPS